MGNMKIYIKQANKQTDCWCSVDKLLGHVMFCNISGPLPGSVGPFSEVLQCSNKDGENVMRLSGWNRCILNFTNMFHYIFFLSFFSFLFFFRRIVLKVVKVCMQLLTYKMEWCSVAVLSIKSVGLPKASLACSRRGYPWNVFKSHRCFRKKIKYDYERGSEEHKSLTFWRRAWSRHPRLCRSGSALQKIGSQIIAF